MTGDRGQLSAGPIPSLHRGWLFWRAGVELHMFQAVAELGFILRGAGRQELYLEELARSFSLR